MSISAASLCQLIEEGHKIQKPLPVMTKFVHNV